MLSSVLCPAACSLALALSLSLTALHPTGPHPTGPQTTAPQTDPATTETPVPTGSTHRATLVLDRAGTGVWTVKAFDVFPQYQGPQAVALDDAGRCFVLVCYSGKWTPFPILEEKEWLGAVDHGDVDPRFEGAELYVAGAKGNVYQIRAYREGVLDARKIASFRGEEVHALLTVPADAPCGPAVLAFTAPGILHRLTPTGEHGEFEEQGTFTFERMRGRVRDAIWLDDAAAVVSRTGEVALVQATSDGADLTVLHRSPVGKGRLARGADRSGGRVLYTTQDDGVILRHRESPAQDPSRAWATDVVHRGAQGPRGIAVGRFDERLAGEQVAIFGYSKRVELLAEDAESGAWTARTIFEDDDKGHWLAPIEIDSRNRTTELLASGYGGRVVLLYRDGSER